MNPESTPKLRCADAIVQSLIDYGVDTVFGLPGAQTYGLFDALHARRDAIKLYCSRHEQGAAYMAFGYAKSSGRTGVFTVVPGPGLLNASAALVSAHSAPVLCLAGQVPSTFAGLGHGMLHEISSQMDILRSMTKWAERIEYAAETQTVMGEAFSRLRTGRPQPVAVELPADVLDMPARKVETRSIPDVWRVDPDPVQVEKAVKLIRTASRPMIMVGSGAVEAGAEVLELARILQAPVVSFRGGRGIVSDELPFGLTCAEGYELWSTTDLLIGIGTRLELPAFRWQSGRPLQKLVRIDLDPRQMVRLRADAPIMADARSATRALIDELSRAGSPRASRVKEFEEVKARTREKIQSVQPQMAYLNAIRDVLPRDGFLVDELCQVGFASWYGFPVYLPRRLITTGYQGNLGYGFQAALGVKIANPTSAVVSITGDGGFMFGVQELATAALHRIPVVIVLFNNRCFGNVRRDQTEMYGGHVYGAELGNPDFLKLAESFGVSAYRANGADELRALLERALGASGPVLIEVPCERGSEASPWSFIMPKGYGGARATAD
ncbi:MAG: thiamine pyrophosphate-binding protein [Steroidobacteraceae bacterium]